MSPEMEIVECESLERDSRGMSDHCLFEGISGVGMRLNRAGCVREVLKVGELDKKEKVIECLRKQKVDWNAVKEHKTSDMEKE